VHIYVCRTTLLWCVFTVSTEPDASTFDLAELDCTFNNSTGGSDSSNNLGLIVGVAVGVCAVIVVIVIIVIVILIRNCISNKHKNVNEDPSRNNYSSDPTTARLVNCEINFSCYQE